MESTEHFLEKTTFQHGGVDNTHLVKYVQTREHERWWYRYIRHLNLCVQWV